MLFQYNSGFFFISIGYRTCIVRVSNNRKLVLCYSGSTANAMWFDCDTTGNYTVDISYLDSCFLWQAVDIKRPNKPTNKCQYSSHNNLTGLVNAQVQVQQKTWWFYLYVNVLCSLLDVLAPQVILLLWPLVLRDVLHALSVGECATVCHRVWHYSCDMSVYQKHPGVTQNRRRWSTRTHGSGVKTSLL